MVHSLTYHRGCPSMKLKLGSRTQFSDGTASMLDGYSGFPVSVNFLKGPSVPQSLTSPKQAVKIPLGTQQAKTQP